MRRALRLNPRAPTGVLQSVAAVNFLAGRRDEAVSQLERIRVAIPDHLVSRIVLTAHYEREGRHEMASAVVGEILRITPDFSVRRASALIAPYEQTLGSQEFAAYMEALRAAGLP